MMSEKPSFGLIKGSAPSSGGIYKFQGSNVYPNIINENSGQSFVSEHNNNIGGIKMKIDIENYLDKIDLDRRESERRITEERRLSEQRIENRFSSCMDRLDCIEEKIERNVDAIKKDNKETINSIRQENRETIDSIRSENKETKRWIMGLCITTILGIAAMVVAIISVVSTMSAT